ncbi:MAG TPA: response regulator [Cyclobacteriaceae bacterium]|nr:response regulator [Cyclobacteriaceae bacterium]
MRIFLIEDDDIYGEFIKKSLLSQDYNVSLFQSAEEAENALKNESPEVFIIDYKLPGKSGIELYEVIKPALKDEQKVIMLSAIDDGNMVLDFIKRGVRDYVIKDDQVIESLITILKGDEDDYYLFN